MIIFVSGVVYHIIKQNQWLDSIRINCRNMRVHWFCYWWLQSSFVVEKKQKDFEASNEKRNSNNN